MGKKRLFKWKNIRLVPAIHNRLEFTLEVRRQFFSVNPDAVAVEYPPTLGEKIIKAIKRLPLLTVVYYEEDDHTIVYLPLEPTDAQVEAIRLALSKDIPIHFIDRDTVGYPINRDPMPDSYSISRIGYWQYCKGFLGARPKPLRDLQDQLRERNMAFHLQQLNKEGKKVLFIGGLSHLPGLLHYLVRPQAQILGRQRRDNIMLAHLHRESSREIMTEIPFIASLYEDFRNGFVKEEPDKLDAIDLLIDKAREKHLRIEKEEITDSQKRIFNKFAMNYAFLNGFLTPDLYEIVIAARGIADDNFAYEVWDLATKYPWQSESPELPVLKIEGKDMFLDQKKIKLHRHFKNSRRRLVPLPVKKRATEQFKGEWEKGFKGYSICSYQPEDIVIEGFGNYLKKKGLKEKAEENRRVIPFMNSIMDGIDIRETLRNWKDGRIYVRENIPLKGSAGSVVVIFDIDLPDKDGKEMFPWCVTWLGEHNQESDMAFYSTPAGKIMIGPGISKCHYGGFLLIFPPMRLYNIWKDSLFDIARNKPERLLLAAIDYALEKYVVYVAPSPPSSLCRKFAYKLSKKILYLPIGIFSPITLNKIRQFHVLDGHPVRQYAGMYI